VLNGLVYFSTCGSCSSYESNPRARRTFAVDARTGRLVWRFNDGEYSPVIADRERLYLTGFTALYGLAKKVP
jgi:outer membrane protein assembly factor BamB